MDLKYELDVEGFFSAGGFLVDVDWGILVGDGIGVLVDEGSGVLVSDGVVVFVREAEGVLVREADGDLVEDADGDLVGEADGVLVGEVDRVLVGEANRDKFSSSMIVELEGGESLTTFGSSWLLVSVFGRSNQTLLGFFFDEEDSISESLYAFVIYCRAYSLAASHSDLRDRNSDLFLFVALVLVGWEFNQILKAL
jgi:hypothetical protein